MRSILTLNLLCFLLYKQGSGTAEVATSIGRHPCTIFNAEAEHVIVIFHGYLSLPEYYYPMARKLVDLGYAVVLPRDCEGPVALPFAASWGEDVAVAVKRWAGSRSVGIVGHSMGGGAAMAAARYVRGLRAFVAMHPAPILSGDDFWTKVKGPILFTTGTADDGTIGGNQIGATAAPVALDAYKQAQSPKALVNVKGDAHVSSQSPDGMEWLAVKNWLDCFVRQRDQACGWVREEMCTSQELEWCDHLGMDLFDVDSVFV